MATIDDRLRARMLQLAEHLESQMPKGLGVMVFFYNTEGADLDVSMCTSHDGAAETLRILRAVMPRLLREAGGANPANERWFAAAENSSASDQVVSSAAVTRAGGHDRVRLWSRGGLAGELVVGAGDGAAIAAAFGLAEKL